ncbi:hypothetical protein [Methylomonas denitrificans]|uniref:hypothetical protein n=1 Tax=Methylomonas denitrificans TaxID=1538553 RepID=UPI001E5D842E|nr:hypothetical protein [Methylomonas denitrificans]
MAELLINGTDLQEKNGWLSIVNDAFHLHIDWRKAQHIWLSAEMTKRMAFRCLISRATPYSTYGWSLITQDSTAPP